MKVLALLSGGKDSHFALMHCIANEHEVVALGSLIPPGVEVVKDVSEEERAGDITPKTQGNEQEAVDKEELNSYMYQSIGLALLPLIAKSLRLPLYTQEIKGGSMKVGGTFGDRRGKRDRDDAGGEEEQGSGEGERRDETEDLEELLVKVKQHHPEINAICTGAILSTYQRTRIESISLRPHLFLTPLSYLWQQPERPLVRSMISSGLAPILVKVAGMGLRVEDVGRGLAELSGLGGRLERLEREWGCHFAGEGGEYETICLDGPMFYERVELVKTETIVTDTSPVAHLRILEAKLIPKPNHTPPTQAEMRELLGLEVAGVDGAEQHVSHAAPELEDDDDEGEEADEEELLHANLLDTQSRELMRILKGKQRALPEDGNGEPNMAEKVEAVRVSQDDSSARQGGDVVRLKRSGRWFSAVVELGEEKGEEAGVAVRQHFESLRDVLHQNNLSLPQIQHINLYLSPMSSFPLINAEYIHWFGAEPPSRACVGVPLESGVCRMEVMGWDDSAAGAGSVAGRLPRRSGLHVQGLSYWAPANIGPYSQGVVADNRLIIAGQIPLIPSTLKLPDPPDITLECVLALQHVRRVTEVMRDTAKGGGGWKGWIEGLIAWYVGKEVEEVMRDVWREYIRIVSRYIAVGLEYLADSIKRGQNRLPAIPVLFVQTTELPRGSRVEWQVVHSTGQPSCAVDQDEADDDEDNDCVGLYEQGRVSDQHWWTRSWSKGGRSAMQIDFFTETRPRLEAAPITMDTTFSARLFHTRRSPDQSRHPIYIEEAFASEDQSKRHAFAKRNIDSSVIEMSGQPYTKPYEVPKGARTYDEEKSDRYRKKHSSRLRSWKRFVFYYFPLHHSQTWSVIAGTFYFVVHVWLTYHDMNTPEVQAYRERWGTYIINPESDPLDASNMGTNDLCAYFPDTAMPNQGYGPEPLLWFGFHESGILLLCILLIVDEGFNSRFGILGPQQSKAGAAYTLLYLFTATASRSLNLGSKGTILLVTYASFAFLAFACIHIVDGLMPLFIDHGHHWHGYRYRLAEESAKVSDLDNINDWQYYQALMMIPGRKPLFGPKGLAFQSWLNDEYLSDPSFLKQGGSSKAFIRGWPISRRHPNASIYKAIEFRRYMSIVAGVCLFLTQFTLFVKDVRQKQIWGYVEQYEMARISFEALNPFGEGSMTPSGCTYYDQSAVPIRMYLDTGFKSAVITNAAYFGLNKFFLCMMSLAIIFVSINNQKYFGDMHFGFSLIGPRFSTVGVGWTLLHVTFASLSQAVFPDVLWLYYICKGVFYFSGLVGLSHIIMSESLQWEDETDPVMWPRHPFFVYFFQRGNNFDRRLTYDGNGNPVPVSDVWGEDVVEVK